MAFLKYADTDHDLQLFVVGATGIKQFSSDGIRELQSLGGELFAIETVGPTGRFFEKFNIVTRQIRRLYKPGKRERFPLFSEGGTKMLTTIKRRDDHYEVQMLELTAPYSAVHILWSKTHLSPRAWPCSGRFAYFLETDTRKILRLDLKNKTLDDVTPPDLSPRNLDPNWFSISCDERTMAVSFYGAGLFAKLQVYRDGRIVHSAENAIEPDVSEDGGAVVYLDGYEPLTRKESDTPAQRIMQYDVHTDQLTELVGPTGIFSVPVFAE